MSTLYKYIEFSYPLLDVRNVEQAIRDLPPAEPLSPSIKERHAPLEVPQSPHAGEESAQPLSINTPVQALSEDAKRLLQKTGDAVSKPLNAIGRIFTEALDEAENRLSNLPGTFSPFELGRDQREGLGLDGQHHRVPSGGYDGLSPVQTPYKPRVRRGQSPSLQFQSPGFVGSYNGPEDSPSRRANAGPGPGSYPNRTLTPSPSAPPLPPRVQALAGQDISRTPTPNLDFTGVQEQIDNAHEQAARAARETLRQIFPMVDRDVVDWVLEAKEGDLGKSIEALLEMSSTT